MSDATAGAVQRECVVLVHGIWMTGIDLWLLAKRLRAAGFDTHVFSYASLRRSPAANADALQRWLERIDAEVVHFVGHSLGGLVLLHLFDRHPQQRPGRLLLLGTPVLGSALAGRLSRHRAGRMVVGRAVERGLLGGAPSWRSEREAGVIAGDRAFGVGKLLGGLPHRNDGTVEVAETRLPGAAHCVLPVSHSGMVLSPQVAKTAIKFLRHGRF